MNRRRAGTPERGEEARGRLEEKYVFVDGARDVILAWLEHACIPGPSYGVETVHTVYFDTPDLTLYGEKRNGDYLKSKVRLRWYAEEPAGRPAPVARWFLEVKLKEGAVCRKRRIDLGPPAGGLRRRPLLDEAISALPARLAELGYTPRGILSPVILIRYRRHRFLDPLSGSRLAVDTGIRAADVNRDLMAAAVPVHLETGVLEIKGMHGGALPCLEPIRSHLRKSAFSKYAECIARATHPVQRRI